MTDCRCAHPFNLQLKLFRQIKKKINLKIYFKKMFLRAEF
jgi:hypothetical protein